MEARRRFHERCAGVARQLASRFFLRVRERRCLQDDLNGDAGHGADDGLDVSFDRDSVAALECADIQHHVDFLRTVGMRSGCAMRLNIRPIAAVRKSDDRDDPRVGIDKQLRRGCDPIGLHAVVGNRPSTHDVRARADVALGRLRPQHRMVDEASEFCARHGEPFCMRARSMRPARYASSAT